MTDGTAGSGTEPAAADGAGGHRPSPRCHEAVDLTWVYEAMPVSWPRYSETPDRLLYGPPVRDGAATEHQYIEPEGLSRHPQ
ncbi:hypothetical protein GGTG_04825 [Gaeumannomyces tritici R3-111a-1]|uniref:Uncharacterized protein n=1 Tax=Gaeumannomyces tritici (strain R3-111a-1) TaxID=644352 RepID=J3NU70_GAET3|nr:hypothetical protein GGTG_04825 [Gaeumannomyces tritici R3-111a-1]EJT79741.1 hypothetical protein GGTG_04825 [Gaeumannomyces tritici R3-111a-1]